jgi:hypothetical protein
LNKASVHVAVSLSLDVFGDLPGGNLQRRIATDVRG